MLNYYIFCYKMSYLVVGEGNLSFSVSLTKLRLKEETKTNTWTSTFEDEITCIKKYGSNTLSNILWLKENHVNVFHSVNATNIKGTLNVGNIHFSKIIFNFPHVGRKAGIKQNRYLLKEFLASCKDVLAVNGSVEITLCAGQGGTPSDSKHREQQNHWQIVEMAALSGFILNDVFEFNYSMYPEYKCTGKRGAGREFILEGAMTHVFVQLPSILQLHKDWDIWPIGENCITPSSISRKIVLANDENQFLTSKFFRNVILSKFQSKLDKNIISNAVEKSLLANLLSCLSQTPNHHTQFSSICGVVVNKCCNADEVLCSQVHYETLMFRKGKTTVEDVSLKLGNSLCPERHNGVTFGWNKMPSRIENLDWVKCMKNYIHAINIKSGINIILTHLNHEKYSIEDFNLITMGSNSDSKSRVIGLLCVLNYNGNLFTFLLLDMDTISCMLIHELAVVNPQILWSLNIETQKRLENTCLLNCNYKPFSLHPPQYEFQLSFWLNDCENDKIKTNKTNRRLEFSTPKFMELLKNVLDNLIVGISLEDEYVSVVDGFARISHCYKIVLQSHDFVLSQSDGRRLEQKLRLNVEKYLKVAVR